MRFLVDRCAGRKVADYLSTQGHDVVESRSLGPDPGDRALLARACQESRVLVTIDTDFGKIIFVEKQPHTGVIRLPDVPAEERVRLLGLVLHRYKPQLQSSAIITVRGSRIRVTLPGKSPPE